MHKLMTETNTQKKTGGKLLNGVVIKAAMQDTVTVAVDRFVQHPKYKKFMRRTKNYLVHNEGNVAGVGDKVTIKEVRPISRNKHFTIVERVAADKAE
jgi:small subunit ribosomal protein S17